MWSEGKSQQQKLENYHRRGSGGLIIAALLAVLGFLVWAAVFRVDEVAQARGEVIASSRVQLIQAVDGGVVEALLVKEGDKVVAGQVLARLDPSRLGASVGETEARLYGLRAKAARLRAEVIGAKAPDFDAELPTRAPETARVERALFVQRMAGLGEELRTLSVAVQLARRELDLIEQLHKDGDASGSDLIRVQRNLNEAEARLINRRNKFLEDARVDLAKAEDEMAQVSQVLNRRRQEQQDSVFTAAVPGIVKNIRVTTVGGVLRAGEELMQIIPVDDDLLIEAKVSTADIARVQPGLAASVRFDAFDYTIYGTVAGRVAYVSADSLKEESSRGVETFYRVRIRPEQLPLRSSTGRALEMLPGMTAQVDIRTGDRSLMDYLLKPLRKTLAESMGER